MRKIFSIAVVAMLAMALCACEESSITALPDGDRDKSGAEDEASAENESAPDGDATEKADGDDDTAENDGDFQADGDANETNPDGDGEIQDSDGDTAESECEGDITRCKGNSLYRCQNGRFIFEQYCDYGCRFAACDPAPDGDTNPTDGDTHPTDGDIEVNPDGDTNPTDGDTHPTDGDTAEAETNLCAGHDKGYCLGSIRIYCWEGEYTGQKDCADSGRICDGECFYPPSDIEGVWRDPVTGWYWQKGPSGGPETYTPDDAATLCNHLTFGGLAWKLPTIKELATLLCGRDTPDTCPVILNDCYKYSCGLHGCEGGDELQGCAPGGCYWKPELAGQPEYPGALCPKGDLWNAYVSSTQVEEWPIDGESGVWTVDFRTGTIRAFTIYSNRKDFMVWCVSVP